MKSNEKSMKMDVRILSSGKTEKRLVNSSRFNQIMLFYLEVGLSRIREQEKRSEIKRYSLVRTESAPLFMGLILKRIQKELSFKLITGICCIVLNRKRLGKSNCFRILLETCCLGKG